MNTASGNYPSVDLPVVGSLCTGYGGLAMGLALALGPIRHAWFAEYDGVNRKGDLTGPKRLLAHRYPDVPNYGDVKTTDWAGVEPIDWLDAGYPCQPFSHAGLRKGTDDPRHLWPGVARAISVLRPRNVLLENVRGHVSLGLDAVLGDLADLGYDCRWGLVRASDAGAPHGRARVFIVATDAGRERHGRGEDRGTLGRVDSEPQDVSWERERARSEPVDRGVAAAPDADMLGHERSRGAWDGRPRPADGAEPVADAAGDGRRKGRAESAGQQGRPDAAKRGDADAAYADKQGPQGSQSAPGLVMPAWGAYEPAIRRWEAVRGPAPRPTEPGRTDERLSPAFVEWMQGLDRGWVTEVPGLSRNEQLKLLGNGVVPQQAALALAMLGVTTMGAAA
jgi:DNA (cytosine-5)-methyltransferase 1